ncbi:MAG: type II toxin-antitoxin system HicB family antitoxin [Tepidisphaeraceae bacterium]|jgi:predicted RNase H-like HicB family nuclease
MSSKSGKSSKAIDRPFDPDVLRRARKIAESYQIVIQFEDGEYYGRGVELPNAMNDGKTPDECVAATRDILTTLVAYMLENGETPPPPASENKRTEQINIRLTAEEKLRLEEAARSKGFRGVSDFVRTASLSTLGK